MRARPPRRLDGQPTPCRVARTRGPPSRRAPTRRPNPRRQAWSRGPPRHHSRAPMRRPMPRRPAWSRRPSRRGPTRPPMPRRQAQPRGPPSHSAPTRRPMPRRPAWSRRPSRSVSTRDRCRAARLGLAARAAASPRGHRVRAARPDPAGGRGDAIACHARSCASAVGCAAGHTACRDTRCAMRPAPRTGARAGLRTFRHPRVSGRAPPAPASPRRPSPHRPGPGHPRADPAFPQQAGLAALRLVLRLRLRADPRPADLVAPAGLNRVLSGPPPTLASDTEGGEPSSARPCRRHPHPPRTGCARSSPSRRFAGCGSSPRSRACATG